jgi:sugar lactone lactonase YvrE
MFGSCGWAVLLVGLVAVLAGPQAAPAQTYSKGDVFVAVGNAQVQWRNANGGLIKTLVAPVAGNAATTGMAFDSATNLYVTMFDSQAVAVFDNGGNFLRFFGSGYDSDPESIVIDSTGDVYVGQADGTHKILKFNLTGTLEEQFSVNPDRRGSDWIDLASDLCTMYFCSEGTHVERFDVCQNLQLPNLNSTPFTNTSAYAHRLLANGDTLVADTQQILRLDDTGTIIQTYTVTGTANNFFALNLDPDGKSFWSGDISNGNVYKFDIASGNLLLQFNAGSSTNGSNTVSVGGIAVAGELTAANTPRTGVCATRTSRFWFTHAYSSNDTSCATLLSALDANVGGISLGFTRLPVFIENNSGVLDVNSALQEALGLYWKTDTKTGENGGTQGAKLTASTVCKQRKLLAIELIAATANVELMGTDPRDCTYSNGRTTTNFDANLLGEARTVLAGDDPTAMATMRALLLKFNRGGQAGDFPPGIVECTQNSTKFLKSIARDPTRQASCGGVNNTCSNATAVYFPTNANPFASSAFSQTINLLPLTYPPSFPAPTCGTGGPNAIWEVKPNLGTANRQFTVSAAGSNFSTMLSVWTGDCAATNAAATGGSNDLTQVICSVNTTGMLGATLTFNTDGSNTFFIVGEGPLGQYGKLKIRVTSP